MPKKTNKPKTMKVKSCDCRLSLGTFELSDHRDENTHDLSPVKVHLNALSGEPMLGFFDSAFILDFAGMTRKDKITINYCHDRSEVLGFIDAFDIESTGLSLDGFLTPIAELDRADEVARKLELGVPYEASIEFPPSKPGDVKIEELEMGESTEVNGQTVDGPLLIVREWPLRGVAICPLGRDSDTATELLSQNDNQEVELVMSKKKTEKPAEVAEVETPVVEEEVVENVVEETIVPEVLSTPAPVDGDDTRNEFKLMVGSFGREKAAEYFELGLSMEQANVKFISEMGTRLAVLEGENAKLTEAINTGSTPAELGGDVTSDEATQLGIPSDAHIEAYCLTMPGSDPEKIKASLIENAKKAKLLKA